MRPRWTYIPLPSWFKAVLNPDDMSRTDCRLLNPTIALRICVPFALCSVQCVACCVQTLSRRAREGPCRRCRRPCNSSPATLPTTAPPWARRCRWCAPGPCQANTGPGRGSCKLKLQLRVGVGVGTPLTAPPPRARLGGRRRLRPSTASRLGQGLLLTPPPRYYVLVAACVLARKAEWIKNACLAAALLLPAVAAVHGIVLAALHRDGEPPCIALRPTATRHAGLKLTHRSSPQMPSTWTSSAPSSSAPSASWPRP